MVGALDSFSGSVCLAEGAAYYELELSNSQLLVLDVEACAKLEGEILDAYGLSQPRSADLL